MLILGGFALMVVAAGVFYRLTARSRNRRPADPGRLPAGEDRPLSEAEAYDRATRQESWRLPGDGGGGFL